MSNAKVRHRRRRRATAGRIADPEVFAYSASLGMTVIVRKSDYDTKPSRLWRIR